MTVKSDVTHTYIIVEKTCGEVYAHTVEGTSVLDVAEKHKARRDWLEAQTDWYEEDTSEVLTVFKVTKSPRRNKKMIESVLDKMEWDVRMNHE